jgi:hypothetical protein
MGNARQRGTLKPRDQSTDSTSFRRRGPRVIDARVLRRDSFGRPSVGQFDRSSAWQSSGATRLIWRRNRPAASGGLTPRPVGSGKSYPSLSASLKVSKRAYCRRSAAITVRLYSATGSHSALLRVALRQDLEARLAGSCIDMLQFGNTSRGTHDNHADHQRPGHHSQADTRRTAIAARSGHSTFSLLPRSPDHLDVCARGGVTRRSVPDRLARCGHGLAGLETPLTTFAARRISEEDGWRRPRTERSPGPFDPRPSPGNEEPVVRQGVRTTRSQSGADELGAAFLPYRNRRQPGALMAVRAIIRSLAATQLRRIDWIVYAPIASRRA